MLTRMVHAHRRQFSIVEEVEDAMQNCCLCTDRVYIQNLSKSIQRRRISVIKKRAERPIISATYESVCQLLRFNFAL